MEDSPSSLKRKRNDAVYSPRDKDANTALFKSQTYRRKVNDRLNDISDDEYRCDSSSSQNTLEKKKLRKKRLTFELSNVYDQDTTEQSEKSEGSEDLESTSELSELSNEGSRVHEQLVDSNEGILKPPKVDLHNVEVADKLKKIHESVEEQEKSAPKEEPSNRQMLFSKRKNELEQYKQIMEVRSRYCRDWNVPPALFADELLEKARKHMSVVEDILQGKRPSMYYEHARQAFKKSNRAMLSIQEFRKFDLHVFTAGYFGIKRQLRVGAEILDSYNDTLLKHKNPTVQWWGPSDFSNYVLAPEILAYVCKDEMSFPDIQEAWSYMESTTDYGLLVADEEPLEIWEIEYEKKRLKRLGLSSEYSTMKYRTYPGKRGGQQKAITEPYALHIGCDVDTKGKTEDLSNDSTEVTD